jgi:hypothetical protein
MKSGNDSKGIFGGWTGGVGGSSRTGLLLSGAKLYGDGDFSSGFGSGLDDNVWRWFCVGKAAGSSLRRMHLGVLSSLAWSDGESAGAGNYGDQGTSDAFSLGMNSNYAMGFSNADYAAFAVWGTKLSDADLHLACTKKAVDLVASSPIAGWLLPEATAGSSISDFTGGGANETSRTNIATSADPADYDFTLTTPFRGGQALPFML